MRGACVATGVPFSPHASEEVREENRGAAGQGSEVDEESRDAKR
jgi:hypothetical protein